MIPDENENLKDEVKRLQEENEAMLFKGYNIGKDVSEGNGITNEDEMFLLKGENQYLKGSFA
ncbi:MAG: hypothetical protein LBK58_01595 [Prevotellaceae bacterium]|jgi:hypothetical protein|nr:hypothetical protein [Prevotellaceae bacterium]